jgi:septum formation protein
MLGIRHEVDPAHIDEDPRSGESAEEVAGRLAREKAHAVSHRRPGRWVLGADTVVVIDGEILNKPESPAHAEEMLARLAGRDHRVVTAIALANNEVLHEARDITRVWFRPLSADLIRAYVATGEPLDKAGAYGVQAAGAALVERIEGDFFGVMGLPLRLVVELLARAGMPYSFTR